MSLGACNCCEEPPCEAPVLEFISVEASCEVCGFSLPAHDDLGEGEECLRFAKKTDTRHVVEHSEDTSSPPNVSTRDYEENWLNIRQKYVDEDGVCQVGFLSGSYDSEEHNVSEDGGGIYIDETTTDTLTAGPDGVWTGTHTFVDALDAGNNDSYSITGSAGVDFSPDGTWTYTSPGIYALSSPTGDETTRMETVEYTEPVDSCEPTMPDWPAWEGESEDELLDGQGYEMTALRTIGGTCDLTTTARAVKWRVRHQPSGTCYLKAWVRTTFTPAVGAPTTTDSTYEWSGTGNPCLADPALAVDHADNMIHGTATEVAAPEDEGVISFEVLKFSCVEGYEPDISDEDNPQPNGYPDPTWEAEPP